MSLQDNPLYDVYTVRQHLQPLWLLQSFEPRCGFGGLVAPRLHVPIWYTPSPRPQNGFPCRCLKVWKHVCCIGVTWSLAVGFADRE